MYKLFIPCRSAIIFLLFFVIAASNSVAQYLDPYKLSNSERLFLGVKYSAPFIPLIDLRTGLQTNFVSAVKKIQGSTPKEVLMITTFKNFPMSTSMIDQLVQLGISKKYTIILLYIEKKMPQGIDSFITSKKTWSDISVFYHDLTRDPWDLLLIGKAPQTFLFDKELSLVDLCDSHKIKTESIIQGLAELEQGNYKKQVSSMYMDDFKCSEAEATFYRTFNVQNGIIEYKKYRIRRNPDRRILVKKVNVKVVNGELIFAEGNYEAYTEEGAVIGTAVYKNRSLLNGKLYHEYANNILKMEYVLNETTNTVTEKEWDNKSRLIGLKTAINNELVKAQRYNQDGLLMSEYVQTGTGTTGTLKTWSPYSQLETKTDYSNGSIQGKYYYADGQVVKEDIYVNGQLKETKKNEALLSSLTEKYKQSFLTSVSKLDHYKTYSVAIGDNSPTYLLTAPLLFVPSVKPNNITSEKPPFLMAFEIKSLPTPVLWERDSYLELSYLLGPYKSFCYLRPVPASTGTYFFQYAGVKYYDFKLDRPGGFNFYGKKSERDNLLTVASQFYVFQKLLSY